MSLPTLNIVQQQFLTRITATVTDLTSDLLDELLDRRDNDNYFSMQWMDCFRGLNSAWTDQPVDLDSQSAVEQARQAIFMAISRATDQHEIASYISDDADMVLRATAIEYQHPFIQDLWQQYADGQVAAPQGS